ncbi:uncharacterized protein ACRADG_012878 [Cochliomyia hominivorax]
MKFLDFLLSFCLMCLLMTTLTKALPTVPTAPPTAPTPPSVNVGESTVTVYDGPSTKPALPATPEVSTIVPLYPTTKK